MAWSGGSFYQIKETAEFVSEVNYLLADFSRWEEAKEAVDWALGRNPHRAGTRISDTDVWALPLETNPPVTIYYTINEDDRTVTLARAYRMTT